MSNPNPPLQPPGAGLPPYEQAISRAMIRTGAVLLSREFATTRFLREEALILGLVQPLSPEGAARRVLIPRLWGLEDSSRHWSALMVLEHLIIVNSAIGDILDHLLRGEPFPVAVSTAAVKPRGASDAVTIDIFRKCDRDYLTLAGAPPTLRTRLRHPHPWFGPLDAHGWHCLAAVHMAIHRRQIEAILRRLR